uniref:RXLR phytopathogen effector protein WY-domain domain-containing protein n=1 Tax=Peronospora matthiolae TaxID=2874970 RepID=A0AAV1UP13_9STRA
MRQLGVLLLFELAVLVAMLTRADVVTKTSEKTIGDTASSAATHSDVAIGRFRRLDETEERALSIPSSLLPQSIPPTGMELIGSWFKSLRPMIKSNYASFADYKHGPLMVVYYLRALWPQILDSVRTRYWLYRRKTIEDVFTLLKLDAGLDKVAYSREFYTWVAFGDLLHTHHLADKWSIARVLSKTYTDLELVRVVDAAKTKKDRRMALRLSRGQRHNWEIAKKSALDIYTLLGLHIKKENGKLRNVFNLPELYTWYIYVYTKYTTDTDFHVVWVLSTHYSKEELRVLFHTTELQGLLRKQQCVEIETAVGKYLLVIEQIKAVVQLYLSALFIAWKGSRI